MEDSIWCFRESWRGRYLKCYSIIVRASIEMVMAD